MKKENISIKISFISVPDDSLNTIPAIIKIIVWRRPRDRP